MNDAGKITLLFLGLILLGSAVNVADTTLGYCLLPWHTAVKNVQSANAIIDKTLDPDRAMAQYTWFKQTKEDIDATQKNIDQMVIDQATYKEENGNMSTWDDQTKYIYSQKQMQLQGQRTYYNQQVANYNAACNDATKNIYLQGLPGHVEQKMWVGF